MLTYAGGQINDEGRNGENWPEVVAGNMDRALQGPYKNDRGPIFSIIIWPCPTRTGNYRIHEFDCLKSIWTAI